MAKNATAAPELDPIESFVKLANTYPKQAIALMLWKERHTNPEMTVHIQPNEVTGFTQCVDYLEVEPEVRIYRPQGLPAQAAVPAQGNRRAIPGRAAQPPKDFVVVQLVDQDGNSIVPVENNEEDQKKGQAFKRLQRYKETAGDLAAKIRTMSVTGDYSSATVAEAAEALAAWARA